MAGEMRRLVLIAVLALLAAAAPAAQAIPHLPGARAGGRQSRRPHARGPDRGLRLRPRDALHAARRAPGHGRAAALAGGQRPRRLLGTYRCERWGKDSASLHAEGRALDWHLDRSNAADAREAQRLIRLLLAPDEAGNPQALARRMGLEEIIWDCGYWGAGMPDFRPYSVCFDKHGKARKHVDVTLAHRDHIHFGLSKAGAAAQTSFWDR